MRHRATSRDITEHFRRSAVRQNISQTPRQTWMTEASDEVRGVARWKRRPWHGTILTVRHGATLSHPIEGVLPRYGLYSTYAIILGGILPISAFWRKFLEKRVKFWTRLTGFGGFRGIEERRSHSRDGLSPSLREAGYGLSKTAVLAGNPRADVLLSIPEKIRNGP